MVGIGHAVQCRHRLSLASCCDDQKLFGRVFVDIVDGDNQALISLDISQLDRDVHRVDHAAARDGHLAPKFVCGVDGLLHPVHIGCEGCDYNTLAGIFEEGLERVPHLFFGHGKAGALGVRAVHQQRQYPVIPELSEAC
ncbi:hypothetical protein SDC9_158806 [bioreactor metagenome]|uniref:Uncharacterized protein n=1 Tax=bioreactor metagenome TaxID=1076179 RepID=A0A645FGU1_9ZZZZ